MYRYYNHNPAGKHVIDCTVKDFCVDHPVGAFVVATSGHVVAVVDGDYYDTSDSGYEIPIYYWRKEIY